MRGMRGFTLVELLAALFAMAMLAALSWRGLDGMVRARQYTEARADEVLALQTGLAQWTADLDAIVDFQQLPALEWNGRVLRLVRRDSMSAGGGAHVVAWTRREARWLRWQSQPLVTRGDVEVAWQQADQWSQNPGDALKRQEVAVTPIEEWQIFFYRGDAWTNPLSSDAATAAAAPPAMPPPTPGGVVNFLVPTRSTGVLPDGVRLVLQLPPGGALAGRIQRDWVRPNLTRPRS
jgi:general secretion pathway protein J